MGLRVGLLHAPPGDALGQPADKGRIATIGRIERADVSEHRAGYSSSTNDVMVRHVTALTLQELGYSTAQAANGQEAIDFLHRDPPDAMILDLLMPIMTGYDVLEWLARDPVGELVDVVILSGFTAELDEFEFVPQVKAVLQKPVVASETASDVRGAAGCGRVDLRARRSPRPGPARNRVRCSTAARGNSSSHVVAARSASGRCRAAAARSRAPGCPAAAPAAHR